MKTKSELSAYYKKWREDHKEELAEKKKIYRSGHRKECSESEMAWRKLHREQINACARARYAKDSKKQAARSEKWRLNNPEKGRNNQLKRWYGITLDEYNAILKKQDGKCAICGIDKPMGVGCFHVDHDHTTNTVRGILCQKCNMAIGLFFDDPNIIKKAYEYLQMRTAASLKSIPGE
jgi:hypothetical protein